LSADVFVTDFVTGACQKTRLVLGENNNINVNSRPTTAQQTVSSKRYLKQ